MSREAMQMALDALTLDLGSAAQIDREADAITALRAALAEQPEQHCTYPACEALTAGGCDGPCGQARRAAQVAEVTPFPPPRWPEDGPFAATGDAYTADQMRAYAAQEVAAERERCADLCDRAAAAAWSAWDAIADPADQGRALEAEALAAEIRGPDDRLGHNLP
jgi:hypothetical protein